MSGGGGGGGRYAACSILRLCALRAGRHDVHCNWPTPPVNGNESVEAYFGVVSKGHRSWRNGFLAPGVPLLCSQPAHGWPSADLRYTKRCSHTQNLPGLLRRGAAFVRCRDRTLSTSAHYPHGPSKSPRVAAHQHSGIAVPHAWVV